MKPYFVALVFGIVLITSAYLSETALHAFKANKHVFSQDEDLTFVYGWVKAKGKAKFFIQQGYRTGSCLSQDLKKEVSTYLDTHFPDLHLVQVEQAGCFNNLLVLNSEKKRLLKNKKEILKFLIPHKSASLAGS